MHLSDKRLKALQALLKEQCGLDLNDAQAQEAGAAILRFMVLKAQREQLATKNKEKNRGQVR